MFYDQPIKTLVCFWKFVLLHYDIILLLCELYHKWQYGVNGFIYRNPLARQHASAADCQLEYVSRVLRKSRHASQFAQSPASLHFTYLRKEHV